MNPSDEITFFCPVVETDTTQPICSAIVQGIESGSFACGELPAPLAEAASANQNQCLNCARNPLVARNNARISQAIVFATQRHAGGLRKGTTLPYILHPLEVLQILSVMKADTDLQIAGLLHDTIEDTATTAQEIAALFGDDVAMLVSHHSEDKSKSWLERKTAALSALREADDRLKMLVLADKLSNLRSIARDYAQLGDGLWQRFNAPKEKQAWYYNGILDALAELDEYVETSAAYQELLTLYKDVFVIYKITPEYDRIYQANTFGEAYCLTKGNPRWEPVNYRFRYNDIPLTRKEAESLEDKWYDLFLNVLEQDLQDHVYPLYHSADQQFSIALQDARLIFDLGTETITLNEDETYTFLSQLRMEHGIAAPLGRVLLQTFGNANGAARFQLFCEQMGLGYLL